MENVRCYHGQVLIPVDSPSFQLIGYVTTTDHSNDVETVYSVGISRYGNLSNVEVDQVYSTDKITHAENIDIKLLMHHVDRCLVIISDRRKTVSISAKLRRVD